MSLPFPLVSSILLLGHSLTVLRQGFGRELNLNAKSAHRCEISEYLTSPRWSVQVGALGAQGEHGQRKREGAGYGQGWEEIRAGGAGP